MLCETCKTAVAVPESHDVSLMVRYGRLLLAWGLGELCCLPKNRKP